MIAVDVSGDWAMRADHVYEDGLSGVTVLLNALNPFAKATRVRSNKNLRVAMSLLMP